MLKKILLILIISFTFFTNNSFADETTTTTIQTVDEKAAIEKAKGIFDDATKEVEGAQSVLNEIDERMKKAEETIVKAENAQSEFDAAKLEYDKLNIEFADISKEDELKISETTKEKLEEAKAAYDAKEKDLITKDEIDAAQKEKKSAESAKIIAEWDLAATYISLKVPEHNYNQALVINWTNKQKMDWANWLVEAAQEELNSFNNIPEDVLMWENAKAEAAAKKAELEKVLSDAKTVATAATKAYVTSAESKDDITSAGYKIFVNDISPGMKVTEDSVKKSINKTLGTIIQSLMLLLWSLALLIMTIGAWFMILHHGQDELLSKWKAIFMSWVYALIVALGSYYLIAIFRYILFTGNN